MHYRPIASSRFLKKYVIDFRRKSQLESLDPIANIGHGGTHIRPPIELHHEVANIVAGI